MITNQIGSAVRINRLYYGRWIGGLISEPSFTIAPVKEVVPNAPRIISVSLLENAVATVKIVLELPTTNTDGSPLALGELKVLRIRYGTAPDDLRYENDFPPGTEISFAPGITGRLYLAAQILDSHGNWSALSDVYEGPEILDFKEEIAFWAHQLNPDAIFSNNSPSQGYISWSNVQITFRGETWSIQDGSTNKRYIWWDYATSKNTFQASDTVPELDLEDVLVAVNIDGTCYLYLYRPMIAADFLRAGMLQSANWGSNAGTQLDLNSGTFKIGGSASPKLVWDGSALTVTGVVNVQGGTVPYSYVTGGPPSNADNTATVIGAGLITTGRILLGSGGTVKAGVDGAGTSDSDVRFWAGATYENRASAPFRVTQGGALVATSVTIMGTVYGTGGWLGSSSALSIQSGGIDVGSAGWIRGGKTAYGSGSGFWLGYSGGYYRFDIGDSTYYLRWTGTGLNVQGQIGGLAGSWMYTGTTQKADVGSAYSHAFSTWISSGQVGTRISADIVSIYYSPYETSLNPYRLRIAYPQGGWVESTSHLTVDASKTLALDGSSIFLDVSGTTYILLQSGYIYMPYGSSQYWVYNGPQYTGGFFSPAKGIYIYLGGARYAIPVYGPV